MEHHPYESKVYRLKIFKKINKNWHRWTWKKKRRKKMMNKNSINKSFWMHNCLWQYLLSLYQRGWKIELFGGATVGKTLLTMEHINNVALGVKKNLHVFLIFNPKFYIHFSTSFQLHRVPLGTRCVYVEEPTLIATEGSYIIVYCVTIEWMDTLEVYISSIPMHLRGGRGRNRYYLCKMSQM